MSRIHATTCAGGWRKSPTLKQREYQEIKKLYGPLLFGAIASILTAAQPSNSCHPVITLGQGRTGIRGGYFRPFNFLVLSRLLPDNSVSVIINSVTDTASFRLTARGP
jgi:hypothetical protein